jgi:hypothetical protein
LRSGTRRAGRRLNERHAGRASTAETTGLKFPSLQAHHQRVRRALPLRHRDTREARAVRLPGRLTAKIGLATGFRAPNPG